MNQQSEHFEESAVFWRLNGSFGCLEEDKYICVHCWRWWRRNKFNWQFNRVERWTCWIGGLRWNRKRMKETPKENMSYNGLCQMAMVFSRYWNFQPIVSMMLLPRKKCSFRLNRLQKCTSRTLKRFRKIFHVPFPSDSTLITIGFHKFTLNEWMKSKWNHTLLLTASSVWWIVQFSSAQLSSAQMQCSRAHVHHWMYYIVGYSIAGVLLVLGRPYSVWFPFNI